MARRLLPLLLVLVGLGTARGELRRVAPPRLGPSCDDLDPGALAAALSRQAEQLLSRPAAPALRFGPRAVSAADYANGTLLTLARLARQGRAALCAALPRRFSFYLARGGPGRFTAYHHPLLHGSRERGGPYQHPLYRRPPPPKDTLSTAEILAGGLGGAGLELLYLTDLAAAFTAHLEGSAEVLLPDGARVNLTTDGSNGRPYQSLVRLLMADGKPPRGQTAPPGRTRAHQYFYEHPDELRGYWERNPHFVFFKETPLRGVGRFGELCPGRSAAVDPEVVPMGAALWLRSVRPGTPEVALSRVALAQDTGAGIRGPGRVDLFFGSGDDAAEAAAHLNAPGSCYVLLAAPQKARAKAKKTPDKAQPSRRSGSTR